MGGTGKTHVEYIIKLIANQNKIAVLSRGYEETSEYIEAKIDHHYHEIEMNHCSLNQNFRNICNCRKTKS